MRIILLISAAALVLAACQKTSSTPAAAKTNSVGGQSAFATTFPHRRAGLWEQSVSTDGKPAIMGAMKVCVDAASEAQASLFGQKAGGAEKSACGAPTVGRALNGDLTFASTCPLGDGATIVTKGTAAGDFSGAYTIHLESDVTGAKSQA